jgi:hypothetical protein
MSDGAARRSVVRPGTTRRDAFANRSREDQRSMPRGANNAACASSSPIVIVLE